MTKSPSEVQDHYDKLRKEHGERVEARQKQKVPPCRGYDNDQSKSD